MGSFTKSSLIGGGAIADVDPGSTAVTPAWRTAITDFTVIPSFSSSNTSDILAIQKTAFDEIQPFRELAPIPAGGQYINEVGATIQIQSAPDSNHIICCSLILWR